MCFRSLLLSMFLLQSTVSLAQSEVATVADATHPVVLLTNGQVIEGKAQQEGDRIVITNSNGDEIRIPSQRVACWGPNVRALREFRVDHRGRPTLKSHLVEAKWCINNGLSGDAAREIQAAFQIAPEHPEAKLLEELLRKKASPSQNVKQVSATEPEAAAPTPSFKPSVLSGFAKHIQPILLNRCGRCHDRTRGREFQLIRLGSRTRVSSGITEQNLHHIAKWIDLESPLESPLITYAQKPHGGIKVAPLGQAHHKAIYNLQQWLRQFASHSDSPQRRPIATPANPFSKTDPPDNLSTDPDIADTIDTAETKRLPPVGDPFDPEMFNRKHHR